MKKILALLPLALAGCKALPMETSLNYMPTDTATANGVTYEKGIDNRGGRWISFKNGDMKVWVIDDHFYANRSATGTFIAPLAIDNNGAYMFARIEMSCDSKTHSVALPILVKANYGNGPENVGQMTGRQIGYDVPDDATSTGQVPFKEGSVAWQYHKLICGA